jgi:peptide-methionine (R)-S-oxide reductase
MRSKALTVILLSFIIIGYSYCQDKSSKKDQGSEKYEVSKTENEWKAILSPEEFNVLREKGTEYAFTGEYFDFKGVGTYTCAGCENEIFSSTTKYNSGCGWPSFYEPLKKGAVEFKEDNSYGMKRTEVLCAKCGGHLGHVFKDGPPPTGLRYCINSISMNFRKKGE